jgi:site-specific DNA recombinase
MNVIEKLKSRGVVPRAALYARFSSDNQREESIEAQLRAMHDYCGRNGVTVVREFCDHAKSATTDDRPEFQNMIDSAKNGGFNLAIVHKLDRFSRNRYDSAYYKRELKKCGVTLLSVLENLDDSPESIILESVLEGMSEYYSKNLAREVMKGLRESALECRYVGGFIPYGFVVDEKTHKYLLSEHEADAVRMAFRDVANGVGYSEVLTHLNDMGYRTRLGNPFTKSTLFEMLRNEKYNGIYVYNRASSKNESGHRNNHLNKPEDEMIRIPGGMPRVVDEDTFARVQNIMDGRKRVGLHKSSLENYLLTGKLFCGLCGHRYVGNRQWSGRGKGKFVSYRCGHRHDTGSTHCENKDVSRLYLEDFILKRIGEIIFDEARIPALIQVYYDSCGDLIGEAAEHLRSLRQNLKVTEERIANVVNVITATGSAALAQSLEELEQSREVLRIQIKDEESGLVTRKIDEEEIVAAYRRAKELYESRELPELRQIINLYLDEVIVYPEYVEIRMNNIPGSHIPPDAGKTPSAGELNGYRFQAAPPPARAAKRANEAASARFAAGEFDPGTGVQSGGAHEKGSQDFKNEILAADGGDDGSRTRVRRQLARAFSERSHCFEFSAPQRPVAGSAVR